MNKMKRYGALLLAAATAICLFLPASAATVPVAPDNGNGTITIHKYDIKSLDGSLLEYGDGKELTGAEEVYDVNGAPRTWNDLINGTNGVSEAIVPQDGATYAIKFFPYDAATASYATTAAQIWDTTPGDFTFDAANLQYKATTGDGSFGVGLIEMTGLKYGMYEFTEVSSVNGFQPLDDPFYIYMPTLVKQEVDPTTGNITSEFITNVHAYPKNTEMGKITKVLMDKKEPTATFGSGTGATELAPDSGLGNHFTYTITVDIKNLTDKTRLEIEDILDSRMKVIRVKVERKSGTDPAVEMTSGYTTDPATITDAATSLKVIIQGADIDAFKALTPAPDKLIVTVTVALDATAPTGTTADARNVVNDAVYRYVDDPNDPPPTPIIIPEPDKPVSQVGDIEIQKKDQKGNPLDGAQFMLFTTLEAAEDGIPSDTLTVIADPTKTGEDRYSFTTATSGTEEGKVVINNVHRSFTPAESGATTQYFTYWLVETKAPDGGYNRLPEPVEVKFSESNATAKLEIPVINHTGFTLPRTGGSGTLLFTVIGLSLITIAGVTLILYRRRRSKGQDVS